MTPSRRGAWPGFLDILCPVDFSEQSRIALRYAEAIARRTAGSRLTVLYVNDPLLVAAAAIALHDRELAKRSAGELEQFVEETLGPAATRQVSITSRIAIGDPADTIVRAAGRGESDLVVLGTQGLTGADRVLLGSTTLDVLRRAAVPVLAIPLLPRSHRTPARRWPGKRIVAAIDLERGAPRQVLAAAKLAHGFGSSLLLVHVINRLSVPPWFGYRPSAHERIRMAKARERMARLAAAARRWAHTDARVVCGNIPDEIAALSAVEDVSFAMVALDDSRSWFGPKRGAISYHVLSHAVAPVLACPPRWKPR